MKVYVDSLLAAVRSRNWRYDTACHLFVEAGTDIEVLHRFAESIALKRCWFQGAGRQRDVPHYDLNASKRELAVASGAVELSRAQAVAQFRAWRKHLEKGETPIPPGRETGPA